MRKSLTCFILLALFTSQAFSSSRGTFLNAFASLNGEVPISKDENGLFVEVDFIEKPQTEAGTAKMLVSLVSHETIMAGANCLGFTTYDCEHLKCEPTVNEREVIAPYLTVQTHEATAQVYLDHKSWHLKANTLISATCKSKFSAEYGKGRQGIIGLGIKEGSDKNYQQQNADKTLFSVSMKKDLSGGSIYFSAKESLTSSMNKLASLKSQENSDWIIPKGGVSFDYPDGIIYTNARVIFDIHADATGLPNGILKMFIDEMKRYGLTDCSDSPYRPKCTYSGKISNLPTLKFQIQEQKMPYPPELYLEQSEEPNKVILNFKSIDEFLDGPTFIDKAFDETFVLGGHFMSYYYTVFKADGIEIYGPKSGSGPWLYVGIGAVVIIAFVATFLYVKKKKGSASQDSMLAGSYEASS